MTLSWWGCRDNVEHRQDMGVATVVTHINLNLNDESRLHLPKIELKSVLVMVD